MNKQMNQPYPLPEGFIEQLKPLLKASLPDFLRSYDEAPLRGIRMREGCPPPEEAREKIPWAENGYYLPLASPAGANALHEAGAYYLQEPSAMAPAAVLRPQPGEKVLDLCAAPGGKSTQLAAMMAGKGLLVCNEPVFSRAQILSRNLERMGAKNAVAVCAMPEELSPLLPEFFDKILVDAPCSGEGMFRRHPETRAEWSREAPAFCARRQMQILRHAADMLRPGGQLVYSTCTFNPVENEGVIEAFLKAFPAFALTPFSLPGLKENDGMLHLFPHELRGEGHFVALLQKAEAEKPTRPEKTPRPAFPPPGKEETQLADAFLREHMPPGFFVNALISGRVVMLPAETPPLPGIRVLRAGLHIGQIRGRNFFPDHALALAQTPTKCIAVTQEQAISFLAGHPLPAPDGQRGWYAPTLGGLALGWGKASDGILKNHYPKGLRKNL